MSSSNHARKAAIEKSLSRYLFLECGHYTTKDTDERYSHWRPSRLHHYCEKCDKFLHVMDKVKRSILPDEPEF